MTYFLFCCISAVNLERTQTSRAWNDGGAGGGLLWAPEGGGGGGGGTSISDITVIIDLKKG